MDRFAVIWTRALGAPMKLADMVLTSTQLRISKTKEAIAARAPGVSLLHDVSGLDTVVYDLQNYRHLPPQLEALLPPSDRNNLQRIILTKILASHLEIRGMPVHEQEWEFLLLAGRNGTGHLDVFRDDANAQAFYDHASHSVLSEPKASSLWQAVKRVADQVATDEAEIKQIVEAIGPTPGVSGFNPKIMTEIPLSAGGDWGGGVAPKAGTSVIVKLETAQYPGLLELEELVYRYHEEAGFPVPRRWLRPVLGNDEQPFWVMAVERFDREAGLPIPMESVFGILRSGSPLKFFSTTDGSMEDAWKAIRLVTANQVEDRKQFFSRFVMSFLTGNGDLHLENMAMLGRAGEAHLSPVFDPAPMRAYRGYPNNHDLLSALSFDGIGGVNDCPYALSGETPRDLFLHLIHFGEQLGLRVDTCRRIIGDLLEVTATYKDAAIGLLERVPETRRRRKAPDIEGFGETLEAIREAAQSVMKPVAKPEASPGL